jgi:hypothetical protein
VLTLIFDGFDPNENDGLTKVLLRDSETDDENRSARLFIHEIEEVGATHVMLLAAGSSEKRATVGAASERPRSGANF